MVPDMNVTRSCVTLFDAHYLPIFALLYAGGCNVHTNNLVNFGFVPLCQVPSFPTAQVQH